MSENNGKLILITCIVISSVIFSGCTVSSFEKPRVTGHVDIDSLEKLFSRYDITLKTGLEKVSIHNLDGAEIASDKNATLTGSFSFQVPSGSAYFLKARTADGVNLWAITPVISNDTDQDISLNTTYEASLIVASLGKPPSSNVNDLKRKAAEALEWDFDRLVKTVKRVVNNAVLKRVDYSPATEMNKETLRAFAGGLEPVRSLDSILYTPEPDYTPHIYTERLVSPLDPGNILVTEIDGKRWDYRIQGISIIMKYPEIKTIPGYPDGFEAKQFSIDRWPSVANGGTKLVFMSTRHCSEQPYPCSYYYFINKTMYIMFRFDTYAIYTISLDAPADVKPTLLTPFDLGNESSDPMLSWDEKKIVFTAGPLLRKDAQQYLNEGLIPERVLPNDAPIQIYVMNDDGTNVTQLTFDRDPSVVNQWPAWSPDNKKIVYVSNKTGNDEIWIMNSDGSGNTQLTNSLGRNNQYGRFSPDGRQILFQSDRDGDYEIFVMDRDGSNVRQLTHNDVLDEYPSWAHDGIDIVYTSRDTLADGKEVDRLIGLNTLTGKIMHDFGDFANASTYGQPVWAATNHMLVLSKDAIKAREFTTQGYVTAQGGSSRISSANPPVQSAYEIKKRPQSTSGCGPGCDKNAYANRALAEAGYVPSPSTFSWSPTTWD